MQFQGNPRVTVLLPAFNAAQYLRDAVRSVLNQTLQDFELLIIDDGSTDDTVAIARKFSDGRVRIILNERNRGLVATLNRGLDLAKGEYIARMDADDICRPTRLQRQFDFMASHVSVGVCGTWFKVFGGRSVVAKPAEDSSTIKASLFWRSPFGHPTVMMRKAALDRYGLRYDPKFEHAEDYDLWERMSGYCDFANLPETLLDYREHPQQASQHYVERQREVANAIRLRQLFAIYPQPSEHEVSFHLRLLSTPYKLTAADCSLAHTWLLRLLRANRDAGCRYDPPAFDRVLADVWYGVIGRSRPLQGLAYLRSSLEPRATTKIYRSARLLLKSVKQLTSASRCADSDIG